MDIRQKALEFVLNAYKNQTSKIEVDKPIIIHLVSVGNILEEYGYDSNLVAAGYLHDVLEDTKNTKFDLEKEFNNDIVSLVLDASSVKRLSEEERKKNEFEKIKDLPLRSKLIICADIINNLEDLILTFEKNGIKDFSKFNRSEEYQKWYYINIYESLINGEDSNLPIFKRLNIAIDNVFNKKEDLFLKNTIFEDSNYYQELKKLHAQKMELERLRKICQLSKPYVIEFSGTPRTGKTTIINNLFDFFKKGGFDVSIIEEFTTSKNYKDNIKKELKDLSLKDINLKIIEIVYQQLKEEIGKNKDIILIDRSINDRQIWNYKRYKSGDIVNKCYMEYRDNYKQKSKELIDYLVVTYADSLTSLKRDYVSSLALEKRNFLNINNVDDYNKNLLELEDLFNESVDNYLFVDTNNISKNDSSVIVAKNIMNSMRSKYIDEFKNKYGLK